MLKINKKPRFLRRYRHMVLSIGISLLTTYGYAIEINTSIQTGNNDVEERSSGRISSTSSDLEMIDDSDIQTIGLRFTNVNIPQGASITTAHIQFTADETNSEVTQLNIHGELSDNAPAFSTTTGDVTSRKQSSSAVFWNVPTWDTTKESGLKQQTPELKSILQEIVNRGGWSANNSMVFVIDGAGKRVADSYEGGIDRAPKLYVSYELGDNVIDNNSSDSNTTIDDTNTTGDTNSSEDTNSGALVVLDTAVSDDADDAEELSNGDISTGSSDLELVYDGANQTVGMRFINLGIPQGATITNAYLKFTVDERDDEVTDLKIYAEKSANPNAFENIGFNITQRAKTTASVPWSVPAWDVSLESGVKQQTPELKSVVQEVVNLADWTIDSNMVFLIDGSGKRVADSHEGGSDRAPKLHIEYRIGGVDSSTTDTNTTSETTDSNSTDNNTTDGQTDNNTTDGGVDSNTTDGGTDNNTTDGGDNNGNSPTTSQKLGTLIPLYVYPDFHKSDSEWQRVIDNKLANPEAEIIVIANPSSGHFSAVDTLYVQAIQKAVESNITVVGYVYTQYGARDINVVKADIDNWTQFYKDLGVTGIFFDETEGRESKGKRPYYKELTDYIKEQGYTISILNPGITADQTFVDNYTADIIVSFESGYNEYLQDFKTGDVGKTVESELTSTALMIHDIDTLAHLKQAIADAPADGFDYVYVTTGDSGWDDLGSDFETHITEMLKYDRDPVPDNGIDDNTTDSGTDNNTTDIGVDSNTTDVGTDNNATNGEDNNTTNDNNESENIENNQTVILATIDRSISSGSDDVEESESGSMSLSSSDLELVQDGSTQTIGLRFINLDIPVGATITSAYIQFNTDETRGVETTLLDIYAQKVSNATLFTSATANASSRTKTSASVNWDVPLWEMVDERGEKQKTPELKTLIQEVIDLNGWQSGNAMAFIIQGVGRRVADAYEGGAQKAPQLHIEYQVSSDSEEANVGSSSNTITYVEDSSVNVFNPDRGLYVADYILTEETDYDIFQEVKDRGYSMAFAPINLYDYGSTATLPDSLLNTIEGHLLEAENLGIKLILRIKYRPNASSSYVDPSLSTILGHMEQLKPLLRDHKDIISVVQAGTIGAWGEWNTLTGEFDSDTDANYKDNMRAVIAKLVEIFPEKYLQIRTPMYKELLYGTAIDYKDEGTAGQITPSLAFGEDIRAKIGHHNDCLLVDDTNYGTYGSNIDFWKNYVANDSKYAPVGGETCGIEQPELTDCSYAVPELRHLQYSYLNDVYHEDVINKWKSQGCYTEIKENLGYRLVAKDFSFDTNNTENRLDITVNIENKGFSAPYVKSEVTFVLKNEYNSYAFPQSDVDMRTFEPERTTTIESAIDTLGVEEGNYCLYMKMGEAFSAIRFSNSQNSNGVAVWDDTLKMNLLGCGIQLP